MRRKNIKIVPNPVTVMPKKSSKFLGQMLIDAIRNRKILLANELIDMGADVWVNIKVRTYNYNALNEAIIRNDIMLVKRILAIKKTDLSSPIVINSLSFNSIFRQNNIKMAKIIGEKVGDKPFSVLDLAFHFSYDENRPELSKYLITKIKDINETNDSRHTALILSASHGHYYAVKFLLKHGANVHIKNKRGRTALTEAIFGTRDSKTIKILLDYGAKLVVSDISEEFMSRLCSKPAVFWLIKKRFKNIIPNKKLFTDSAEAFQAKLSEKIIEKANDLFLRPKSQKEIRLIKEINKRPRL
jgi:ankyrin repeat protein